MYHLIYEDSVNSGIGHLVRVNALFTELCKIVGPLVSTKPLDQDGFIRKGLGESDVVVYDTMKEPDLREIKKHKAKCFCIDPPYMLNQTWDGVIFPHLHTTEARIENAITRTKSRKKDAILFGPNTIIMSPKMLGHHILPPKRRKNQVVFSAGGMDHEDALSKMYELTVDITDFAGRVFMKGVMYRGALSRIESKEVMPWGINAMNSSKLAVTMMGITVYEYLSLGVPVMVFPRTAYDSHALDVLKNEYGNMVTSLPNIDNIDAEELCNLIKFKINTLETNFKSVSELKKWSETTIGKNGTTNVANFLLRSQAN